MSFIHRLILAVSARFSWIISLFALYSVLKIAIDVQGVQDFLAGRAGPACSRECRERGVYDLIRDHCPSRELATLRESFTHCCTSVVILLP